MIPDTGGPETEGWQERALERRAQKLASKLAEQLFQERADQLTAKAKEIVKAGPTPCECKQHAGILISYVKLHASSLDKTHVLYIIYFI